MHDDKKCGAVITMRVVNFAQNSQLATVCPQCVSWVAGQTHVVANLVIGVGFLDMLLLL